MNEAQGGDQRNQDRMRLALSGMRAPESREIIKPQIVEAYRSIAHLDMVEQSLVERNERRLDQIKTLVKSGIIDIDEGFLLARALMNEVSIESRKDKTTGLLNKAGFEERLDNLMRSSSESNTSLIVGVGDLEGFKGVNDAIGHAAGDMVLLITANQLSDALRFYDTLARQNGNSDDTTQSSAGRPHGDEFLLACPNVPLQIIAERLRDPELRKNFDRNVKQQLLKLVEDPRYEFLLQKKDGGKMSLEEFAAALSPLELGIRFGFAEYKPGETPESLIKRADDDMNAQRQFEDPEKRSRR